MQNIATLVRRGFPQQSYRPFKSRKEEGNLQEPTETRMASQYSVQATELAGRKGKLRFAGKKKLLKYVS
ncbi:hypothetical protein IFM47457_09288 [Aspergillus lentulus]|nr:hypothetical protein IFM47457_09288 [Aspergillus lentulus]